MKVTAVGQLQNRFAHEIIVDRLADRVLLDAVVRVQVQVDVDDDTLLGFLLEIVDAHRNGHAEILEKNAPHALQADQFVRRR